MNTKEERNKKIFAIVIVIVVLFLGIYKLFFEKEIIEEEKIDTETISLVKDNSRFYTVSSCVSKYISYLTKSDTKNLMILLSNEYKNLNSITDQNIYNYIGTFVGDKTFTPKKMFEQRVSKSIYKYYVYGFIQEEYMDFVSEKVDYYLIVILNEEDMTFAVEPYDGSMFK